MIPPENRAILIKKLKEGFDIRNACIHAKINRPSLYMHYKEDPDFKIKVHKTIETFSQRQQTRDTLSARHALRRIKQGLRNKMK